MFSSIRMIFAVILITGIAGAGMYVMKLRSDNVLLKANQLKLETAIEDQTKLLEQQKPMDHLQIYQSRDVLLLQDVDHLQYEQHLLLLLVLMLYFFLFVAIH